MPPSPSSGSCKLSWRKKLIFASLTVVVFFVTLELALALVGVDPVTDSGDPFVGFSSQVPLFNSDVNSDGDPVLETAPGKLVWFNPQSFAERKPAGTRRVFCVGGSTTYGRPFSDSTSYCGWIRELLPVVDSSVSWEVINAGGVSYASYRVAAVMEELSQYEPDLFVVFSAHNEFLERRTYAGMFEQTPLRRNLTAALQKTRSWAVVDGAISLVRPPRKMSKEQLPSEVDEMLNHSIGPSQYHRDDDWHENVLRHYEWNLSRMVSIAHQADAEIIFVAPASNLRDCWPFKSEHPKNLDRETADELEQQLRLAKSMIDQERFDEALTSCHAILAIDRRHAEALFHSGRALFGLGRFSEAEQAFRRAIDEDVCPLRATSRIGESIRRVARQENAPWVDFDRLLSDRCQSEQGHGCVGGEYFLDHVHPTIDVHRDLALWIIEELQDQKLAGGGPPSDAELEQVQQQIENGIDTDAQGVAFRNLAKVLHWAGKFHEAAPRARDAIVLIPHDLESRFILADCLHNMGRQEDALEEYENLFLVGDYFQAYLPFGELLADLGDFTTAKSYLMQALLTDNEEHRARAHYLLGRVHLQLGEYAFAAESLRLSDELYPNESATLMWLAAAYIGTGDVTPAIESLNRVVAIEPRHFQAHFELATAYLAQKQLTDARRHIEIALQIQPDNSQARQKHETILQLEPRP